MNAAAGPFRWTVDEYQKMIRHGILTDRHKVELIRGEIVTKMPKGDRHFACLKRLTKLLIDLLGDLATTSIQDPIVLVDSEPEPDVSILHYRSDCYESGKPIPKDVFLVIEVADSSLDYDRDVKGPLYSGNGIQDYWIVNLRDRCLEIYREPQPNGTFASKQILGPGESVSPLMLPSVTVELSRIIGAP